MKGDRWKMSSERLQAAKAIFVLLGNFDTDALANSGDGFRGFETDILRNKS
jgi:hypothetical protein